jgi:hypothetical protein
MAVRLLLGRCGLIKTSNAEALNDIIDEDEPTSKPAKVSRAASLTSQLSCITPSKKYQPDETDQIVTSLEKTVPDLLECISSPLPSAKEKTYKQCKAKKTESLQKLHDLTKKGKEHNRIPLVSSTKWDIIRVLSTALLEIQDEIATTDKPEMNQDRRMICWTLNNLSIPYENKAIMVHGDSSSLLFEALGNVIRRNLPSSYLCIICFFNLTFLAEAIEPIAWYVLPTITETGASTKISIETGHISEKGQRLLENPASLLRSLERLMLTNAPFLLSSVTSVQGEAIRWAVGLIRNITFANQNIGGTSATQTDDSLSGSTGRQGDVDNSIIQDICTLISQTEIPRLIVSFVRDSPNPAVKWTKDSLEDMCLGVLCQLVQWSSSREALQRAGATLSLEQIEGQVCVLLGMLQN